MHIAVTTGIYNEEKTIARLLDSLLAQTRPPDEIIISDDGSHDQTGEIVRAYCRQNPQIKYLFQTNRGPACARNLAWKSANADICVFTDGDCVPEPNWIETLTSPFSDEDVGATAGTYKTLNPECSLAQFIGLEIAWKYRNISGQIDAHGAYNLAVRKKILEELGGFREDYPEPSGEDWDLTYRISRKHKLLFVPAAVVGHHHPHRFWEYMKNQTRRAYDRIKVYRDHPDKYRGDVYTGKIVKYQVLGAGVLIPSLAFFYPFFPGSFLAPIGLISFLFASTFLPFPYFLSRDIRVAFFSLPVQFFRFFAWFAGALAGLYTFGFNPWKK